MNKSEILADLRKQFGPGAYLYAKDIAVLLNKPSVGAVYELMKRKGGLPWPITYVGKSPTVKVYDVAESLADDSIKAKPPEPGKPVLPPPKHKINKELTKAIGLLRGQQQFIDQVCAEIDSLILESEIAMPSDDPEKKTKKPRKPEKPRTV